MSFELVLFLGLASLAVLFAVGMLLSENAVHSAMFLIGNFGCVAVMYLMLNAPFIGMVQIAVYAGAIMVLFLFVIMLLGAEQTTDTDRQFRWLTGAATILSASFLIAIAAPLVFGGVNLPRPPAADPSVRFIHAAGVPDNAPVNITLSGAGLAEPLLIENATFTTTTDFVRVPAGTYNVLIQGVDGSPIAPPATLTLNAGEMVSAVVTGALNVDAGTFPTVIAVPQSAEPSGDDETRVLFFNGFSATPLSLVDLGPNDIVDTRGRPQLDANGVAVLDGAGTPILVDQVSDVVIVRDVALNAVPLPVMVDSGEHNLAVVDQNNAVVIHLAEDALNRNTETLVFISPDYQEYLGNDLAYRALVLQSDSLVVNTSAAIGSPASIGQLLFVDYLLPVNVVGTLLLVALVGVVVLTRPDNEKADRRVVRRRKVSRPLTSVIATQTGGEVTEEAPKLPAPQSGD